MCTVTFLPKGKFDYILTSNRDESIKRANAMHPALEKVGNSNVLFPMDGSKKGTWVGVSEQNRTLCLLNGAFEKHKRTDDYIKSRGLIVLDFFQNKSTFELVNTYDLKNIEPFTLIIIDVDKNVRELTQLKWDGKIKYIKRLNANDMHIWSSATLYNLKEANHKEAIFKQLNINNLNAESIFKFHELSTVSEPLLMKYTNSTSSIETISTTQIESFGSTATIKYKSFKDKSESQELINFK